jgi:hypothetical protein
LCGRLISLQVALSLVLITCAGLLGRSLQKLETQDFGVAIDSRKVVTIAPSLTMAAPEESGDPIFTSWNQITSLLRRRPAAVGA